MVFLYLLDRWNVFGEQRDQTTNVKSNVLDRRATTHHTERALLRVSPRSGILRTSVQTQPELPFPRYPMPKFATTVGAVICLVSFLAVPQSVLAQPVTDVTFKTPVQLPGVLLPAGSYQFAITGGRIVRVSGADGRNLATLAVVPITRSTPGTIVIMRPPLAGAPAEVSALYAGGGTAGVEFVYRQAPK